MIDLKITVYKMAVGHQYIAPWCAWATWKNRDGARQGMNCEGETRKKALHKMGKMIDNEKRT